MLRHTKFESLPDKNSPAPGVLNADRIRRPRIERLWDGLAKQKRRCAKHHQAPQLSPAKRTHLKHPRQHIARKHAAGSIHAAVLSSVPGAKVGIDFVMRRSQVKLRPPPKHVMGKEH